MVGYQSCIARSRRATTKRNTIVPVLSALTIMVHFIGYAQLQQDFPVTNAQVRAILQDSSTLYIGGWFDYAGPNTGNGVVLDSSSGKYNPIFPKVNGTVYVAVPDGKGGWYVGGQFTKVGKAYRNSLAHVLSDGSVDSWNPNVRAQMGSSLEAAWVYSIVLVHSMVYVGGLFDHVGDTARSMAAAVDIVTGLPTAWNPDADNIVKAIIWTPSTVYLGGGFHMLQVGEPIQFLRSGLASVDPWTGVPTNWNPGAGIGTSWSVNTLQLVDSTLYVGGKFNTLGAIARNGIGAVDASTGLVTPWNPNMGGTLVPQIVISAMTISGNTMYIGGTFGKMGKLARSNLAAASLSGNGTVLSWNPNVSFVRKGEFSVSSLSNYTIGVYSIQASGSNVYVGGFFNSTNGIERRNLAAFDTSTGVVGAWDPSASDPVWVLKKSGTAFYAGGHFTSVNGFTRNGLAAIDLKTRTVNAWNPNVNQPVEALALYGSKIFVGGYFDTVGTQNTAILAAVDKKTGAVDPWTLNTISAGGVGTLSIYKDVLYVGGWFYTMGDSTRSAIAAIDLKSGKVLPWYPGVMRSPTSFAPTDSIIYAAGAFGPDSQYSFAALNAVTGKAAPPWSQFTLSTHIAFVTKILLRDNLLYGIGQFATPGGFPSNPTLFRIDPATKNATEFGPQFAGYDYLNNNINDCAISGSTAYVVGVFNAVNGVAQSGIAAIDIATGAVKPWKPYIPGVGNVVAVDSTRQTVFIGGNFDLIGDDPASYLAAYTDTSLGKITTVVKSLEQQPREFSLDQNYPNPFNPTTVIEFSIAKLSIAKLQIFDMLGREVATLVNEQKPAGTYTVTWDASTLASGVYFYRLQSGGKLQTRTMTLLK